MRDIWVRSTTVAAAIAIATACSDVPTTPLERGAAGSPLADDALQDWPRRLLHGPQPPPPSAPILVGAGDIAECYQGSVPPPINEADPMGSAAQRTAQLLDRIPGTVIAVGDNAYQFGSFFDYRACYQPTWGRHFDRTRPATGNHEYMTPGAAGYFEYFRERAFPTPLPPGTNPGLPGNGYYSYDVGSWHVIVLNSTPQVYACYPPEFTQVIRQLPWIPPPQLSAVPTSAALGRLCAGDAPQQVWLVADLARNADKVCTAVYFHHPLFSSGVHGKHYQMQRVWDILYQHGVDVVIAGHDHNYERFAPQDRDGRRDPVYGIRQFVVGTGGSDLRTVGPPIANSEVVLAGTHGVIALGLSNGSYGWAFVAVDGSVRDAGTGECHGAPHG